MRHAAATGNWGTSPQRQQAASSIAAAQARAGTGATIGSVAPAGRRLNAGRGGGGVKGGGRGKAAGRGGKGGGVPLEKMSLAAFEADHRRWYRWRAHSFNDDGAHFYLRLGKVDVRRRALFHIGTRRRRRLSRRSRGCMCHTTSGHFSPASVLPCISPASPLHLPCISPVGSHRGPSGRRADLCSDDAPRPSAGTFDLRVIRREFDL